MKNIGGTQRLDDDDIRYINERFKKEKGIFFNATVGKWIATGGQVIVHHLHANNSSERFVIKVFYPDKNRPISKLEKAFNKINDVNDRLIEEGQENRISKILDRFMVSTNENRLLCYVERYLKCLSNYEVSKKEREKVYREIAFRIGYDLLPLLQCCIDQEDKNTGEGIIYHRDIKIDNIFLRNDKVSDGLCLGDFGIVTHSDSLGTPTTTNNLFAGTPATMAPDILMQNRKDKYFKRLDKLDMYSLGITMFFFLNNGTYPFTKSISNSEEDISQWLEERKKGCSKKLPFGSDELKEIVYRAIEFYPKDRFKSCREMFEALKGTPEHKEFIEKKEQELSHILPEQFIIPDKMCGNRLDGRFILNSFVGINHIGGLYRGYDEIDKHTVLIEIFDKNLYSSSKEQETFKSKIKSFTTCTLDPINVNHISYGNRFWYTVFKDTDVDSFNRFVNEFFEDKCVKEDVSESTKEKILKKRCKILISLILLFVIVSICSLSVIIKRDIIPYFEETNNGSVVEEVDNNQYSVLEGINDAI